MAMFIVQVQKSYFPSIFQLFFKKILNNHNNSIKIFYSQNDKMDVSPGSFY